MTTQFEREIREQPAVLAGLLSSRPAIEDAARAIRAARPRFAVIAARGTSDNAARYAVYQLGARNQLAVALAAPSLHGVYGTPPDLSASVALGISQSGQSPDVVAVIADARRQGALTLALTNDLESPLARAAERRLHLAAGPERAVAASKTFTAELMILAMLSAALAESDEMWRELHEVPRAAEAALATLAPARRAAAELGAGPVVVLGRGFNRATAYEAALKLKETALLFAEASSWADFLHGPIAMLGDGGPGLLLIAPGGHTAAGAQPILERARAAGARAIVVSDRAELLGGAAVGLALPAGGPEWLSPIPAAVAIQLLALAAAEGRGLDPDRPRGLAKVTRTV